MLTIASFDLLNTIVTGDVTVHTLWAAVRSRLDSDKAADEILLNSLIELSEAGMVFLRSEQDYGSSSPETWSDPGAEAVLSAWRHGFSHSGPRDEQPDGFTFTLIATARGAKEASSDRYDCYLEILREWYRWD